MRLKTSRFGQIDIEDSKILNFKDGIPGLEMLKNFTLISTEETEPFHWLQSTDDPDISLAVINPLLVMADYAPMVPEELFSELDIKSNDDILLLAVAVIPEKLENMTANLTAPVIINIRNNKARQVILENSEYPLRFSIFNQINEIVTGGAADAGTGKED